MRAWERERAAFARLEPRLRRRYLGRWVGISAGRIVGVGKDPEALDSGEATLQHRRRRSKPR